MFYSQLCEKGVRKSHTSGLIKKPHSEHLFCARFQLDHRETEMSKANGLGYFLQELFKVGRQFSLIQSFRNTKSFDPSSLFVVCIKSAKGERNCTRQTSTHKSPAYKWHASLWFTFHCNCMAISNVKGRGEVQFSNVPTLIL